MLGRRLTLIVILLAPLALGQGGAALQPLLDDAAPGSTLRLTEGAFAGPARLDKPLDIVGVDQRTSITGGLTLAQNASVRFVRVSDAPVGLTVANGALARIGPAIFERVDTAIRVEAGAIVLLRNDPTIPMTLDVQDGARFYWTTLASVEARDARTGAPLDTIVATLTSPDHTIRMPSHREIDIPLRERASDGTERAAGADWVLHLRADGYVERTIPAPDVPLAPAPPLRLDMEPSAPTPTPSPTPTPTATPSVPPATDPAATSPLGPAPTDVETSLDPSAPTTDAATSTEESLARASLDTAATAPRAPPPGEIGTVAAVAVGATVGLAAAGASGALLLRSERRLWKLALLLAPLYTRLRKRDLLDNPTRERIREHVEANPGVRYRELQRALTLQNGALAHHLRILLREKLVEETREGHSVRFFLPGARPDAPLDTGERVIAFLREAPGATGADVARALAISSSLAGYHLERLADQGRIRRERQGGAVRAWAREDG